VWMQQGGVALTGRGQQFNAALADLYPFAQNVNTVLAVLNRDGIATRTLLGDGGQVFSALSASPGQLQGFVRNSDRLFSATAARDVALAETIRQFPGFLRQSRTTVDRVTRFADETKPLIDELHPAAVQLSPALQSVQTLAPELKTLFADVGPLTNASRTGFPALRTFLRQSVPFLTALKPYLGNVVPVIDYLNVYRAELAGFFANSAASTQATSLDNTNQSLHELRISNPINPEVLMPFAKRPQTNRTNPYLGPGGFGQLVKGLPSFGRYLCTTNPLPAVGASLDDPSTATSIAGTMLTLGEVVRTFLITADPSGPACRSQAPLGRQTTGQHSTFPSLQPLK
jgi:phospholipid/cholesterol/gamma-HCH transport system substrate-binding protein